MQLLPKRLIKLHGKNKSPCAERSKTSAIIPVLNSQIEGFWWNLNRSKAISPGVNYTVHSARLQFPNCTAALNLFVWA